MRELETQSKSTSAEGADSFTVQKLKEELRTQLEAMARNATYLSELENRLETSDDRIEDLTRQIADLELASHQEKVVDNHALQAAAEDRLRAELIAKDGQLRELQVKFDRMMRECTLLVDERVKLQASNERLELAQEQLQQRMDILSSLPQDSENGRIIINDTRETSDTQTKVPGSPVSATADLTSSSNDFQESGTLVTAPEHAKTLKELSFVKAQYQEARKKLGILTSESEISGVTFPDEAAFSDVAKDFKKGAKEEGRINGKDTSSPDVRCGSDFQVGRGQLEPSITWVSKS